MQSDCSFPSFVLAQNNLTVFASNYMYMYERISEMVRNILHFTPPASQHHQHQQYSHTCTHANTTSDMGPSAHSPLSTHTLTPQHTHSPLSTHTLTPQHTHTHASAHSPLSTHTLTPQHIHSPLSTLTPQHTHPSAHTLTLSIHTLTPQHIHTHPSTHTHSPLSTHTHTHPSAHTLTPPLY